MNSEEFEENDEYPDWFREVLTSDGQDWSEKEENIQRQWDLIRRMPKIQRELEVAAMARQSLRAARSEASELKTSIQELTQKVPVLTGILQGKLTHNQKKKRTVDAKIETALAGVREALEDLTPLQKKRVLREYKATL